MSYTISMVYIYIYIYIYIEFRFVRRFPIQFNGHGFLIRDYIGDYAQLQAEPMCPIFLVP